MENYANIKGAEVPVMNQAGIMGVLKVEFSRARRYNCPLSCILIQIDRFEYLRDLYGLKIAQSISDTIISMINGNTRLSDFLGKIGERLFLILPHTDREGGNITADRIKEKLSSLDIEISGKQIKVTLSIGRTDNQDEDSIFYDSLLKRCETALNQAIQQGGDCVVLHHSEE